MKVELEDVMFWMDAIRNSNDHYRTLESFWKGQLRSKVWLIENLQKQIKDKQCNVVIHGGWNGVLANLFLNKDIRLSEVTPIKSKIIFRLSFLILFIDSSSLKPFILIVKSHKFLNFFVPSSSILLFKIKIISYLSLS